MSSNDTRIMYLYNLGCLVCTFILLDTRVNGIIRGDCPIACICNGINVTCDHHWTKLPSLPIGTEIGKIAHGNFGQLLSPSDCQTYNNITVFSLPNNNISTIGYDAFKCMPQLQVLELGGNAIQDIPEIFQYVPYLWNISLSENRIKPDVVLPRLCTAKNLKGIMIHTNNMVIKSGTLDCFRYLNNLINVDLNHNIIQGSVKHVLQPLQNVSHYVSVRHCNVTSLENYAFARFRLQVLDLAFNSIRLIPKYAFRDLPYLKMLFLQSNGISDTHGWFAQLTAQVINLYFNNLTKVPTIPKTMSTVYLSNCNYYMLPNMSFSHLDSLTGLTVSYSRISRIERHAFYKIPKLSHLSLQGNHINGESLSNLLLDLVDCPNLRNLNLYGNPLLELNKTFDIFKPNILEDLVLNNCAIEKIIPRTFENFGKLLRLDLSYNRLVFLEPGTFDGLAQLHYLKLTDNFLREFDGYLTGLQNSPLTDLAISNNAIISVSLQNMSALAKIDLYNNGVISITSDTFRNLSSLEYLDLSTNQVYDIEKGAFDLPKLTHLDISNQESKIWDLSDSFWLLQNLDHLYLSGSLIGLLVLEQQQDIWKNLHQLKTLVMGDCSISALVPVMFNTLNQLDSLDMKSNRIPSIEPTAFQNLSELTQLYLDLNFISYVTWESFVYVPKLRVLSLTGNPLLCTCQVQWLYQALTTDNVVYVPDDQGLRSRLVCHSPVNVQNIRLRNLKFEITDCEDKWMHIVLPIAAIAASGLVLMLLYFVWHYRWRLRYIAFLARAGRGRYEEMLDDQEYVYDAFLAYSSEDLPWVKEHLLPNIDADYVGFGGFKLCLHHRNWLVGVDIAENIVQSIVESRRTIVVLSKDFAKSYWCRFELAMAHKQLDAEGHRRDRLLVILMGDIPSKLLSPQMVHILTSKTILPWPNDPAQENQFWKTLRKSLRKVLLYR